MFVRSFSVSLTQGLFHDFSSHHSLSASYTETDALRLFSDYFSRRSVLLSSERPYHLEFSFELDSFSLSDWISVWRRSRDLFRDRSFRRSRLVSFHVCDCTNFKSWSSYSRYRFITSLKELRLYFSSAPITRCIHFSIDVWYI